MPSNLDSPGERDSVLVLSYYDDATIDVVIKELDKRGTDYYVVDSRDYPLNCSLTGRISGESVDVQLTDVHGRRVPLSRIRSVWCRRPRSFGFPKDMAATTVSFAQAEARQAFSGLLQTQPYLWVNDPRFESLANLKPVQLTVASQIGLEIPETLITNDPAEAERFFEESQGEVLYKRMAQRLLYTGDGGLTAFFATKLEPRHRDFFEQVRVAPCCFQAYVEKAYEVRATVVADKVFAARVDSQSAQDTSVDWRGGGEEVLWHPYTLPDDIASMLIEYLRRFQIVFGAFDLIRTPSGSYVFLECNVAGQWAWFEEDITFAIRDAVVDLLTAGPAPRTFPLAAATTIPA